MNHKQARQIVDDIFEGVIPPNMYLCNIEKVFDWNVVAIDVLSYEYNDYLEDLMDDLENTLEDTYMILLNTHTIQ